MNIPPSVSSVKNGLISFCFDSGSHPALVAHATPLINFAIFLKTTKHIDDLSQLRNLAVQLLSRYRQTLATLSVSKQDAIVADYILCAMIDDAVLSQSSDRRVGWAQCGLTAHFHRDVNGGDHFFVILNDTLAAPQPNKPLLLLLYYCLSLCFEGRLRLSNNPASEHKKYLDRLYQALLPDFGTNLSDTKLNKSRLPVYKRKFRLSGLSVLIAVLISTNLLFATLYYVLLLPIQNKTAEQLAVLTHYKSPAVFSAAKASELSPKPIVAQTVPATLELQQLLAVEIKNKDIALFKRKDGTFCIRILKNPLFASASDKLDFHATGLIKRIGEAIALTSRAVTVLGFTDSQPIHSHRFPSNQILSQARAKTIAKLLHPAMPSIVIRAEGKGAAEAVAPNTTSAGRALNRRVEIYLSPKTTGTG